LDPLFIYSSDTDPKRFSPFVPGMNIKIIENIIPTKDNKDMSAHGHE